MECDGSKRSYSNRCAEILYPANSDFLLEEVATRLSSSITKNDEMTTLS